MPKRPDPPRDDPKGDPIVPTVSLHDHRPPPAALRRALGLPPAVKDDDRREYRPAERLDA
jgi:hypothetical protein